MWIVLPRKSESCKGAKCLAGTDPSNATARFLSLNATALKERKRERRKNEQQN